MHIVNLIVIDLVEILFRKWKDVFFEYSPLKNKEN